MEFLKDHISEKTYSLLEKELHGNDRVKLANLADGRYVSVDKYNSLYRKFKVYRDGVSGLKKALESLKLTERDKGGALQKRKK